MIVVVGSLAAGALYVGTQDQRSAENARRMQQSFSVAEQGAFAQVRAWNNNWANLATYPTTASTPYPTSSNTVSIAQTTVAGIGAYNGTIYHIGSTQYLLDVTGLDPLSLAGNPAGGGARKRVGLLVRALPAAPTVAAAYVTRGGSGHLRGGYTVDGDDTAPPSWTGCPPSITPISGFVTNDTSAWISSKYNLSGVDGGPPAYKQDPSITEAKMDTIGNTSMTYDDLVAQATITLGGGSYTPAPVISGTTCVTSNTNNWGSPYAPTGPCASYFPIVHITGDLVVRGTSGVTGGQGILLVDGSVKAFNFRFDGMVIIKGSIDSTHFFRVDGAVQEKNRNETLNQDVWDVQFVYSSCALGKVFEKLGGGVSLLRSRSWAELY
jgi:type II secretory pathway pseudopilin PulG